MSQAAIRSEKGRTLLDFESCNLNLSSAAVLTVTVALHWLPQAEADSPQAPAAAHSESERASESDSNAGTGSATVRENLRVLYRNSRKKSKEAKTKGSWAHWHQLPPSSTTSRRGTPQNMWLNTFFFFFNKRIYSCHTPPPTKHCQC